MVWIRCLDTLSSIQGWFWWSEVGLTVLDVVDDVCFRSSRVWSVSFAAFYLAGASLVFCLDLQCWEMGECWIVEEGGVVEGVRRRWLFAAASWESFLAWARLALAWHFGVCRVWVVGAPCCLLFLFSVYCCCIWCFSINLAFFGRAAGSIIYTADRVMTFSSEFISCIHYSGGGADSGSYISIAGSEPLPVWLADAPSTTGWHVVGFGVFVAVMAVFPASRCTGDLVAPFGSLVQACWSH